MLLALWSACSTTTTPPTTPTPPSVTTTTVLSAACALEDNAIRARCTVTLAAPGSFAAVFTAPGAPTRTFEAEGAEVLAWGLRPDTDYTWAIGDHTGALSTGSLPAALQDATITVTGAASGFDAVLFPLRCPGADYFTMIDPDGGIVWYEQNDVYFDGQMTGYDWSQPSRTVLSVNAATFEEQAVSGEVVLRLDQGADFAEDLHHDVARWGDLRYLLFEYPVGGLKVDGVHVFDGDQLVGTFDLADHYTIPSVGAGDWSHTNAIKVAETGEVVVSLHTFSSVLGFDGDPASPTFLAPTFVANGQPSGLPDPDYAPVTGGFELQHGTSRHGDDLWVFDNMSQPTSRAVRYAMDAGAGTLTETGSWSFDRVCDNQGGAIPLDGGGVLASCANAAQVAQFAEGATEPDWTLAARCGEAGGVGTLPLLRGIPVWVR